MMIKCPECGSSDIVPDLLTNTDGHQQAAYPLPLRWSGTL